MEEGSDRSMESVRGRFQGIRNIILFNYPYYGFVLLILILIIVARGVETNFVPYFDILAGVLIVLTVTSLLTSYYIYDVSPLYELTAIRNITLSPNGNIMNVHAGYDKTSETLQLIYPSAQLTVLDFYDPQVHTERSIRRARKKYPPYPNTIRVNTTSLPFKDNQANLILVFLAAHEIRQQNERVRFFSELSRVLASDGCIIVTEHLRDLPNFLAYSIGSFHFFSHSSWLHTFEDAGLNIEEQIKNTPFIRTFILRKNGYTA